jgi:hypothetical protein
MNENEDGNYGGNDGDGEFEGGGEDPFGTYGRAYYAPGARVALGLGDAYDLSAWTWARDCGAPYYSAKKRKRHGRAGLQCCGFHADPATAKAPSAGSSPGPGAVYSAPIHAASAPQLSCAQLPDSEMECLHASANATARGRVARPAEHEPVRANAWNARDRASGHRSGIRPLLLPQKLGLSGAGGEMDKAKTNAVVISGGHGREATGWELDLERGMLCGDGCVEG